MTQLHIFSALVLLSVLAVHAERFYLGSGIDGTSFASANLTTYLGASVMDNNLRLTTSSAVTTGVVVYAQPVTAHLGFTTRFIWNATDCSTSVNLLSDTKYTDGVSFFISETNPAVNQINESSAFMGIGKLSNAISIGYVTSLNEYHFCDWINAPVMSPPFFRLNCRIFPSLQPRFLYGANMFQIGFNYETNVISVSLNGAALFDYPLQRKLKPVPYYVGIAAGNDIFPRQQDIPLWTWESRSIVTEFAQEISRFSTLGQVLVDDNRLLKLTSSSYNSTGLMVLRDSMVLVQQQFSTKFKWTVLDCDDTSKGGEGFAMFFTKTRPELVSETRSIGAGLGVQFRNNMTILGYDHYLNEFYACNWTTPISGSFRDACSTVPNPLAKFACDQSYAFEVLYNQGVAKVSVNGVFLFAIELKLDADPYTIGFSGSTGQSSYATQYISKWSYNSTNIQFEEKIRVTDFSSQQDLFVTAGVVQVTSFAQMGKFGAVVLKKPIPAHLGFFSNFTYRAMGYPYSTASINGFSVFITSDPLALQLTQNVTNSDVGMRNLTNVILVTRSFVGNFKICKWSKFESDAADFRYGAAYCYIPAVINYMPLYTYFGKNLSVGLAMNEQWLTFNLGETVVKAPVPAITPGLYYVGAVMGSYDDQTQRISSWTVSQPAGLDQFSFSLTNHTDYMTPYGSASIADDVIQTASDSPGLVVHKTPVPAHLGFFATFNWQPYNCNDSSGFNLFLTKTSPTDVVVKSDMDTGRIGTAALSSLTSISYSSGASEYRAYFNSTLTPAFASLSTKTYTPLSCTNFSKISISYTPMNRLIVSVNDVVMVIENRTRTAIYPSFYYIGVSGIGGSVSNWNYISIAPVKQQFDSGFNNRSEIDLFGTASIIDNKLRLTTGGSESGVGMYPSTVYAHTGFNSTLTWTPTNCDEANNGADGFTLFLTKANPLPGDVYMSSGGLLGVGSVPNVVMFAYSATYNEFYVCNWTTPLEVNFRWICNYVIPAPGPKMTCPNTYIFSYSYDHETFTLSVNGTQQFTASLMLEPVPYFVGLSGATGGGYFQQDVSDWSFESIAL